MGQPATQTPIRAAGAVLWRRTPASGLGHREPLGRVEIALIHRPRYDDWSHPKGKLKSGEAVAQAALREVKEETGMDCLLGPQLPASYYLVNGRPKEVRYWAAEAIGGTFLPNREVDLLLWLPPAAARNRLTHERDRPLVDALVRTLGNIT
ncbi:NUDIX hydrolase [Streptomyces silvisoli]|uniref:NUDIX hydrolase n=1 Tax=Streptomyces silvisoli TaxID=3034235 RepID=A0ABT5ZUP4_9ACTN|nr:NUDIX hydrolase [Streptomyces silvisoli]MDF3292733.1 NUDIX hydrolase [Streptomyces silvisoli]